MLRSGPSLLPANWIGKIGSARSLPELRSTTRSIVRHLGLRHHTYSLWTPDGTSPSFFTDYPPDWMSHYLEAGFVADDPVVRYGLSGLDGRWSDLAKRPLPGRERRVLTTARDFGITDGLVLSNPSTSCTGILTAMPDCTALKAAAHLDEIKGSFEVLSTVVHEKARRLVLEDTSTLNLTTTEKALLDHMIKGIPPADWGQTLRLSDREIQWLMKSIMIKAGAANPRLAVARRRLELEVA